MIYNLALLGDPIEQSLSPQIHSEFFAKTNLKGGYICLQTPISKLKQTVKYLQELNFKGVNLTIPLKQAVLELADDLSDEVKMIGATNTLIFKKNGKIIAENTDWIGFLDSLPLSVKNQSKKIALLGAGGSARAVIAALLRMSVSEITIFIRETSSSRQNAEFLVSMIKNKNSNMKIEILLLDAVFVAKKNTFDLVINTTPLGMYGDKVSESPIAEEFFLNTTNQECFFYDLIYNPAETRFLKQAQKAGFETQNGFLMLQLQAAHAFSLWTGAELQSLL